MDIFGMPIGAAPARLAHKKAAGHELHALRRSPEGWCLRDLPDFSGHLVVKNTQTRISYNPLTIREYLLLLSRK